MPKKQLTAKEMRAELKRLNAFIKANDVSTVSSGSYRITENVVNTKEYGERYVFVHIEKEDTKSRKAIKAIRYGAKGRGKARWNQEAVGWSILAEALKGTQFAA